MPILRRQGRMMGDTPPLESLTLGSELSISKKPRQKKTISQSAPVARFRPQWQQAPDSSAIQQPRSFEYSFEDSGVPLALTGEALSQLYVIFGAPGVGKSFFLKRLLEQLGDGARWPLPWGGLLLDPKQTLIGDVKKSLPQDRMHIIGPGAGQRMNLLASHLGPYDLGTALALAAQSSGISAKDPYWINEMKRLFGDGLALLQLTGQPLTLNKLAALFLGSVESAKGVRRTRLSIAFDKAQDMKFGEDDQRRREAVLSSLADFLESKGDNSNTVRSFMRQILSPFLDPSLDFVSEPESKDSVSDIIIRDGKWILLDIPKSNLAISRFLTTLTKVLFASGALSRFSLYPGNDRRAFLFADEYAEIASDLPGEGFGDNYFFSQARQFRVLSFIATQGIPMLENSGVRETWKGILTNSAGKLLFRVGDADTAELASKLMGESDVITIDSNVSHAGDGANIGMGQRLDRWTLLSSDLFITGLKRGSFVFMGLLDGSGTASIRFVKVS